MVGTVYLIYKKYLYDVKKSGVWSCPATTGERPPVCADLTFTAVSDKRAVLFGGHNGSQEGFTNNVFIIDFSTMVSKIMTDNMYYYYKDH